MIEAPFQKHSKTSREAAVSIAGKAASFKQKVYGAFLVAGALGLTDEECSTRLLLDPNTQRPRRVSLVEDGMVVDSGERRLTRGGRMATVWVVAQFARGVRE